jgi:hypothetical protein
MIILQPPAAALPGGANPVTTTYRMLDEIGTFASGIALFQAINNAGRQVGVRYMGPNANQAAGGVPGYKLLRRHHDVGNPIAFGLELQATINTMNLATGNGIPWVANQLYQQLVPTWANGTIRPFQNPPMPPRAPMIGGNRGAAPPTPPAAIAGMLNAWIAGTAPALPTRDQIDAIMMVLEPWLANGPGCATRIQFDPHKVIVNGTARPPHCGLFHELMHAYYNSIGGQLGREDSLDENNGGRLFECMAVGLGVFGARPLSENVFRAEMNVALRLSYP